MPIFPQFISTNNCIFVLIKSQWSMAVEMSFGSIKHSDELSVVDSIQAIYFDLYLWLCYEMPCRLATKSTELTDCSCHTTKLVSWNTQNIRLKFFETVEITTCAIFNKHVCEIWAKIKENSVWNDLTSICSHYIYWHHGCFNKETKVAWDSFIKYVWSCGQGLKSF